MVIDKVKIPYNMKVDFRDHGDTGSNIVEAYVQKDGVIGGFLGQKFQGYRGERKTFTLKDLQEFINFIFSHKKFKPFSLIVIDFFGSRDFNPQSTENRQELSPPGPKKKHFKVDRDSRKNHRNSSRW